MFDPFMISLALFVGPNASLQVSSAHPASDGEIHIDEGQRPHAVERTFRGSCGDDVYFVAITPGDAADPRSVASVRVNGAEIDANQRRSLVRALPATHSIVEAVFDRCSPQGARARISLAEPSRRSLEFYTFWLSQGGVITDVRAN